MARQEGVEPPTAWFVARYSIQLSYWRAEASIIRIEPGLVKDTTSCRQRMTPYTEGGHHLVHEKL